MIFSTNKAFIFIALAVTSPNMATGSHNYLRSNQQQDQRTLLDADEAPITGSPTNISSNLVEPDIQFREYFKNIRTAFSVNTIPYDSTIPFSKHEDDDLYEPNMNLNRKKCTVVGIGHVGSALVSNLINKDLCGSIAMISPDEKKLKAQAEDFQQGSAFFPSSIEILASSKYDISADSDLVFVTAGVEPKSGGSRDDGLVEGVALMKEIIPQVISYSPSTSIVIVSNPADILTAVANKIAGPAFPSGRIFGTGTYLDTSRLKTIIADSAGIDPSSVEGFMIGEHGPNSIPVWSSVHLGPLPLLTPGQEPDDTLKAIHQTVINDGWDVVDGKGYTNWAIALTATHIAEMVLNDTRSIVPVSTCVRGLYGVEYDVYLSVPSVLTSNGISRIEVLPLTDSEQDIFQKSAKSMWTKQQTVWDSLNTM